MLRTRPLLFDAFPDLEAGTPWMPLAHVPTAVESCDAIAPWLGRSGVFMKRDDLVSPLYGGNKVRRWEFVLADARRRGARRIVTIGGLASTQAMATTLFGKSLGFDVTVVLFEQPVTTFARESLRALVHAGAELEYAGGYAATAWKAWRAKRRAGADGYFIMPGASGALANLGFIDASLELAQQVERGEAPRPDVIVVPTGSAGTLAALALGCAHLGWSTEIIGVRITTALATNRAMVKAVLRNTDKALAARARGWRPQRGNVRYGLYGAALGKGYGYPTEAAIEGAEQVRALTGAVGEVTYSGKALAALREIARTRPRATILLWNTLSTARPPAPPDAPVPASLRWAFEGDVRV
ncbi:MAG: pyridoxal-phosphate dependent enzyme [Labilithrix sp.]|nr:pyridoxal-phosphate dependent enzyme [Labilithrix sp.]MCW5816993.1 pyridoxal-phosphate dependent enzyme [Labilithrix sp.]